MRSTSEPPYITTLIIENHTQTLIRVPCAQSGLGIEVPCPDMFRSHDLADKETVMGLFDTQCLLLTTLPETFRVLSALSFSARSREMARLCFTIRK